MKYSMILGRVDSIPGICSRSEIIKVIAHIASISSSFSLEISNILAIKVNNMSKQVPYPSNVADLNYSGLLAIKFTSGTAAADKTSSRIPLS
jgi:hypothetical protein